MNLKNSGDSTRFEPMTSAMPVQCANQLSYEVTQLNKHRTSYNTSFILSTLLINQIFVNHSPTDAAPVSLETNPLQSDHCFIVPSLPLPLSWLKLPNWQEKSSVLNTRAKHARETQGTYEVSLSSRVERPVSVSRARVSFPLFFYPPKLEATRSLK